MGDIENETEAGEAAAVPFTKAEAIFLQLGTLAGASIRTDRVSGGIRLSMGEDCEDGMAEFRRLESAKRRVNDR